MHVYRIARHQQALETGACEYFGTLDAAHKAIKQWPKEAWGFCFLELFDVPTDRDSLIGLLNGRPFATRLRSWELTDRGGLKEDMAPDDDYVALQVV